MPSVSVSVKINAPLSKVYEIAKDNEAFPTFMSDVKSVEVLERGEGRVVSAWVGIISAFGLKVKWRQEDIWDDANYTCHFRQLEGDYDKMEGVWKFTEEPDGCRLDTEMEYEYVVPTMGALLNKVVYHLVVKNLESMNQAFKTKAESS